ncbi:MAG: S-layer homology domain-containing protein [Lachnospiraceae bacterium]|nr:S-layer homology domain-containing protein [Lachnospiraceae bacterium]
MDLDLTNKDNLTVICGRKIYLAAQPDPPDPELKVVWKASNKNVSVNDKGEVTGRSAGEVTVTAEGSNGASAERDILVMYKDVTDPGDFWFTPVYWGRSSGIVNGYEDTAGDYVTFRPENICTAAQMVTFLWRMSGSPEPEETEAVYTDAVEKNYFYKPVLWGAENGIMEPRRNEDGTFTADVKENCTRGMVMRALWILAGKPEPEAEGIPFSDVPERLEDGSENPFYKAVLWAAENQITEGYKDGTFHPEKECVRRIIVTFLYRYNKQIL